MWNNAIVKFKVNLPKCGITQMSSSTDVKHQRCDIADLWSSTEVDFHKCEISKLWSSTNVDFHKCEFPQLSSYVKDPSKLFGYRRLAYEKDIQYDEILPSE